MGLCWAGGGLADECGDHPEDDEQGEHDERESVAEAHVHLAPTPMAGHAAYRDERWAPRTGGGALGGTTGRA